MKVVTVTSKIVTSTIPVCWGYINKTFCWGNKVIFSVRNLRGAGIKKNTLPVALSRERE